MSEHGAGPVTLMDVANEAGVSLATASRAFNGSTRNVGEGLRQRVFDAAAKLNYSANAPAQAMARGRTNVVGLVVHDIADPYFSSIAAGVMKAAEEHHLVVTLGSTLRRPERELEYFAALRGQRSRAVILAGSRLNNSHLLGALRQQIEAFQQSGGRVVMISQQKLPVDTVVLENRAGARALATELAGLGFRRFAVLAGTRELLTARDRLVGFKDGLSKAGLGAPLVIEGDFTRDGGYSAMAELLATKQNVDCVFAVNDVMAVGAMAACRDHGLRLPDDLALAGFDDIATLRDVTPALTTVRLPLEAIGAAAVEMILTADDQPPRQKRIRGDVIIRASTPPRSRR
jgi:LacI family transcriptional regulator